MSRKLLLADDSITIQKVIGITFVNEDFELSVVGDGDAAFEKARADRPDLILADVFMPGKNGYELCAAIKADPALTRIPVLLLTGTFEPFDEIRAKQSGADGWIAKPFESQTLVNRVRELLAKADAAATSVLEPARPVAGEFYGVNEPETEAVEADLWEELGEGAPALAVAEMSAAEVAGATKEVDFSDLLVTDEKPASGAAASGDIWDTLSLDDEGPAAEALSPGKTVADDIWAVEEAHGAESPAMADMTPSEPFVSLPTMEEGTATPAFVFSEEEESFGFVEEPPTESDAEVDDELVAFGEEPLLETPALAEADDDELMDLNEDDLLLLEEGDAVEAEEPPIAIDGESEGDMPMLIEDEFLAPPSEAVGEVPLVDGDFFGGIVATPEAPLLEPGVPELASEVLVMEPAVTAFESASAEIESGAEAANFPFAAGASEFTSVFGEPAPTLPELEAKVAGASAVEARVGALSDEELSAIVEKVAGAVIERLAKTILEKVAWEVVPDLAEALIKEELHQIREGLRQTG